MTQGPNIPWKVITLTLAIGLGAVIIWLALIISGLMDLGLSLL